MKDDNVVKTTLLQLEKQVELHLVDINQAITQPQWMAKVEDIATHLEQGDFKLHA